MEVKYMAWTISKGLAYIITLYTITSLAFSDQGCSKIDPYFLFENELFSIMASPLSDSDTCFDSETILEDIDQFFSGMFRKTF